METFSLDSSEVFSKALGGTFPLPSFHAVVSERSWPFLIVGSERGNRIPVRIRRGKLRSPLGDFIKVLISSDGIQPWRSQLWAVWLTCTPALRQLPLPGETEVLAGTVCPAASTGAHVRSRSGFWVLQPDFLEQAGA